MSTNKTHLSHLASSALKGIRNITIGRPSVPTASAVAVAASASTDEPILSNSEHPINDVVSHVNKIIVILHDLDPTSDTLVNEIVRKLDSSEYDLPTAINELSDILKTALDRKMHSDFTTHESDLDVLRGELEDLFLALSRNMRQLEATAVTHTQINELGDQLREVMSVVLDLNRQGQDRTMILELRAAIESHNISLKDALRRFSPVFAAIVGSTTVHGENLSTLNANFTQLSGQIEALRLETPQRDQIQAFAARLNELYDRIIALSTGHSNLEGSMLRLSTEMTRIQDNLTQIGNNIESGGLYFQDALSCLSAGLTNVIENRVVTNIRANTLEVNQIRTSFERELLSIQSSIAAIRENAVQPQRIESLQNNIVALLQSSSEQNNQQLQTIFRELRLLQDRALSADQFNALVRALETSAPQQTAFQQSILDKLNEIESNLVDRNMLQEYLNAAVGIHRGLEEHMTDMRDEWRHHRDAQIAASRQLVEHVTTECNQVRQHVTAQCDSVKHHITSQANIIIAEVRRLFSEFQAQSAMRSTATSGHTTPPRGQNRFSLFRSTPVSEHSIIWTEHNSNHRLRADGLIVKGSRVFDQTESQAFVKSHNLEHLLNINPQNTLRAS